MRIRLKTECKFDKVTVNHNGSDISVTRAWTEVPSDFPVSFTGKKPMEIEGFEEPIHKTIVKPVETVVKEEPKIEKIIEEKPIIKKIKKKTGRFF